METNRSDAEIKNVIRKRLARDGRVDHNNMDVKVDGGVVVLEGEAMNYLASSAAFDLACDTAGVRAIDNHLKVSWPPSSIPGDGELKRRIEAVLDWNPAVSRDDIEIEVESGSVTLRGATPNYWEKGKAEELAREIEGVVFVNNEIGVVPTRDIEDRLIADDILEEIDRSLVLEAGKVDVAVSNGVATLGGTVADSGAMRRLISIVETTPGLVGIDNNVVVRLSRKID